MAKSFPVKVHKFNSTWRRGDKWLMWGSGKSKGLSFRDEWVREASQLPFEEWLKAKGIPISVSSHKPEGIPPKYNPAAKPASAKRKPRLVIFMRKNKAKAT